MPEAWAQGLVDTAAAQNDGVHNAEQHAVRSPAPQAFASGAKKCFNRPSWRAGREKFAHLHIEWVKPLRYAEANGDYNAYFEQFNDASSSR